MVEINSITLETNAIQNSSMKSLIENVDMSYTPIENNSMDNLFNGCSSLNSVTNINRNVTNMHCAFYNCTNLKQITLFDGIVDTSMAFENCSNITGIGYVPQTLTNMYRTFAGCSKLNHVDSAIPNTVTNMYQTFAGCTSLYSTVSTYSGFDDIDYEYTYQGCTSISSAGIPSGVKSMTGTFYGCSHLYNVYSIPNSVTDMNYSFSHCTNLSNTPEFPNNLTNMVNTFEYCTKLNTVKDIPNSVVNMNSTFYNCSGLSGDIYIYSENVSDATNCFAETSSEKNIYIPFKNNGINTSTYNAFNIAGYSSTTRVNGVLLIDTKKDEIDVTDWDYINDGNDNITLTKYKGTNPDVTVPNID